MPPADADRAAALHTAAMPAALVLATAGAILASGAMLASGGVTLIVSGAAVIRAERSSFWAPADTPDAEARRCRAMGLGFILFGALLVSGGWTMGPG